MTPRDEADLRRFFDGTLMPGEVVDVLLRLATMFPYATISKGIGPVRPLPSRNQPFPPISLVQGDRTFDLTDFLSVNRISGIVVLKEGQIVLEHYDLGLDAETHWPSCSVAKSVASALVGAALHDGSIRDLDDPLTDYLRIGGPYTEVTIRQLLRMATGVSWREEYVDATSERRRLLEQQLKFEPRAVIGFMSGLARLGPPGSSWAYNTGESYLVGALLEQATGEPVDKYLQKKIWSRLGMEQDATWWLDSPAGMVVTGSGMGATLRDYARFGQFVLDGGIIDGERVVPVGWFDESGAPYNIDGKQIPYGYMWWIPELPAPELQGSYQAEGIYGQYIHVNPREKLVIVLASARSKPNYHLRFEFNDDAFFAAVARVLR